MLSPRSAVGGRRNNAHSLMADGLSDWCVVDTAQHHSSNLPSQGIVFLSLVYVTNVDKSISTIRNLINYGGF